MKSKLPFRILVCLLMMTVLFSGCKKQESQQKQNTSDDKTYLYYTNNKVTDLVSVSYHLDRHKNGQLGAEELLSKMRKVKDDSDYKTAIPKRVVIDSVTVLNNVATVDFSVGYKRLAANEDLLCRAAIVYTVTQLDAIEYVEFYVSGSPMLDTDGKAIGALSKNSFVFSDLPMNEE